MPTERKLTEHVRGLLSRWELAKFYHEEKVGNNRYHVIFPFTYSPPNHQRVERVIKPLFLGQPTSTKILDHGDVWLQKVRRLLSIKAAPERIIFPVELPEEKDGERFDAAASLIQDFKSEGVDVVDKGDDSGLRTLAAVLL